VSPSAPVARLQDAQRTLLSVVVASALAVACIAVLPTAALASPPSVPVVTAPLDEGSFAVGAIVPFGATADTGSVLECKLDSGSWGSCPVNYTPGDGSKIAVGWRTRLVFGQELGTSRVDVGQLHYGSHSSYLNGQDAGTRFADAMWWDSDQSNCSSFPYGNEYGGAYGVVLTADGTPTSLTNEFGLDCSITSKYSTGDLLQELAAGDHTLAVRATNGTGTSDPANVTFTIEIGATDPTLDTGVNDVSKPSVIKGEGYGLLGLAGTDPEPTPVFQWQRCSAKDDASSCQAISESGADGAWWGTRDADIGKQVRLTVGWDTVQGRIDAFSPLSGLIGPAGITNGTLSTASPKVGVKVHSSFGQFAGWIPGVSTTQTTWMVCSELDESTCAVSEYDPSNGGGTGGQWYTPGPNDAGKYLFAVRTITTYGMSTSVLSLSDGDSANWSRVASAGGSSRRARAAVRPHAAVRPRAQAAVRKPARSSRHHRARAGRRLSAHAARR